MTRPPGRHVGDIGVLNSRSSVFAVVWRLSLENFRGIVGVRIHQPRAGRHQYDAMMPASRAHSAGLPPPAARFGKPSGCVTVCAAVSSSPASNPSCRTTSDAR